MGRDMTQEQADWIESWALTVEANPAFYDQSEDPWVPTSTSCGCLIHVARWLQEREVGDERPSNWFTLEAATGLSASELNHIYTWRCDPLKPSASEGAAYLRSFIPEDLR